MSRIDKKLHKEVMRKLRSGESKLVLMKEYESKLDVGELGGLLAYYPDYQLRKKYKTLNNILISILILLTFVKGIDAYFLYYELYGIYTIFLLSFNFIFIYAIYIQNASAYLLLGLFVIWGLAKTLVEPEISNSLSLLTQALWVGYLAAAIACAYLSFYLRRKLFPYFTWSGPKEGEYGSIYFTAEKENES